MRLLSDSEGKTVRDYDMKNLIGTRRGVIVIDREGVIRFRKVVMPIFRPTDDEVLDAINEASK
jgi:peroxiredoxin